MDKKLVIVVSLVIVVVSAGFMYLLLRDTSTSAPSSSDEQSVSSPAPNSMDSTNVTAGTYTDYSEEKLAQTAGVKILFFHAAWCPQCRQLEAEIKNGGIPSGVTIFKVDYDTNQSLRQKYGVRLQTTLVSVDGSGNEIAKFIAYDDPTLKAVIDNLL